MTYKSLRHSALFLDLEVLIQGLLVSSIIIFLSTKNFVESIQLQFLEEKHSSSGRGRHAAKSVARTVVAEDQCKALTSALEEVQHKGTLMWRLETLENRALQLSLEVDVENTSRSSSSTSQGPEKIGHDEVSTVLSKEDEQMIIANKEKQDNSLIDQEITCTAEACVGSSKASQKGRRHKMKHRKWLGWLAMGC